MDQHPLTNKKLFKKFWDYTVDADVMGQVFYTPDGVRAAADWQLEQVKEWLRNNLKSEHFYWRITTPAGYKRDEIDVYQVLKELQEAMHPTTQEDNND